MEITELRIGNIIRHNVKDDETGGFCEPNEDKISEDDFNMFILDTSQLKKSKPIKLNEKWLMRFGFYRCNNAFDKKVNDEQIFSVWNIPESKTFTLNEMVFNIEIRYVHQLQNIYFALTGTELVLSAVGEKI